MKPITLILLTLLSSISLANDIGVSTSFKIKSIRISESTGITYIIPDGALVTKNSSCTATDMYAIKNSPENITYNSMYSSLLSAAVSGRDIKIWISTEDGDCHNNRQRISLIEILF